MTLFATMSSVSCVPLFMPVGGVIRPHPDHSWHEHFHSVLNTANKC